MTPYDQGVWESAYPVVRASISPAGIRLETVALVFAGSVEAAAWLHAYMIIRDAERRAREVQGG